MPKYKLGDRVTVSVEKKARRAAPRRPGVPGPHYGAIRRIEDPTDNLGQANILLMDSSTVWADGSDDFHLPGPTPPHPTGVMAYVAPMGGGNANTRHALQMTDIGATEVARVAGVLQNNIFFKDDVKLPPVSGTTYRTLEHSMPLPSREIDRLQLAIRLGRNIPVKAGNAMPPPIPAADRLAKAEAAIPPDTALIAALTQEVHESSFATATDICIGAYDPQLWFASAQADQRDLWRDFGTFKPRIQVGTYALAADSPLHFEPFDLNDTDNFKITKRNAGAGFATFDSTEVPAKRISVSGRSKQVKVYLVPQLWRRQLTYHQVLVDRYDDNTGAIGYVEFGRDLSDDAYLPAWSSPLVLTGWETPPTGTGIPVQQHLHVSDDGAWLPSNTDYLRFCMQMSFWFGRPTTVPLTPSTSNPFGGAFLWSFAILFASMSGHVTLTQEGAPAKMLVAGLEFGDSDEDRFFVWRKTARVASTTTLYNGPFDDPGYYNPGAGTVYEFSRVTSGPPLSTTIDPPGPTASATYPSPAHTFTWTDGGMCSGSVWPYLMKPRQCDL